VAGNKRKYKRKRKKEKRRQTSFRSESTYTFLTHPSGQVRGKKEEGKGRSGRRNKELLLFFQWPINIPLGGGNIKKKKKGEKGRGSSRASVFTENLHASPTAP